MVGFVFSLCFTFGCQKQAEVVAEEEKAVQEEPKEAMDLAQVRQSIAEANSKFGEAVRSGNATALASLYTEDTRFLPAKGEMIQGSEGVEAYWAGALQSGIKEIVLTTVEIIGMGDMVCEIGKAAVTIQPEGQETIEDIGKYVVIWKKTADGAWKLHVDIWNTNLPLQ